MRIRKFGALFGAALILGGCLMLYLITDLTFMAPELEDNKWVQFEGRLKQLEADLHKHHETVGKLKHTIKDLMHKNLNSVQGKFNSSAYLHHQSDPSTVKESGDFKCSLRSHSIPNVTLQMLKTYDELKFDNLDGGVWKQGWNIVYDSRSWSSRKKLKVFVVPHSHNDPGWLKTFEDYYQSQTRSILNNMVQKLLIDHRRKFIWAEVSYLSMWWDEISSDVKEQVKQLVSNGQLEIVTGGWVMNDEANSHYYSIINQLLVGHQWLQSQLGYTPRSSWAIDPFGHTPSMPYLLTKMGLENLVIQRVHYSIKKHLARGRNLEFRWRQLWDGLGSTDLLTHMMPFYSYDVPHTCGPDPKVCCQFDFQRLPGYGVSCPWRVPPQVVTPRNVAHRAELLLDQYRKKAQLFRTNVVLVPLGDDFRYQRASEWDAQFNNYQALFDYMNNNPDLHVQAQFGTLSEYFDAVRAEMSAEQFPTLSGDFFTYADRDDHYWSGYYTSRPFYKRMDRVLAGYLRAAQVLLALGWGGGREDTGWLLAPESGLSKLLSDASRNLALFQHHDGITGTARDAVMEDYGRRLLDGLRGCQHVIQQVAHFLLSPSQPQYQPDVERAHFELDDSRRHHYSLPERTVLKLGDGLRRVVLYNSLTWERRELVTVRVSVPYVKVTDAEGSTVPSQTSPVFLRSGVLGDTHYDVSWVAEVPPLGLSTYFVHGLQQLEYSTSDNTFASIRLYNTPGEVPRVEGFSDVEALAELTEFSVDNSLLAATFGPQGLLKAVTLKQSGVTLPIHLDFARYSARPGQERSGAYLFLPDGPAITVRLDAPAVAVIRGPLLSQVRVVAPQLHHIVSLYNTKGADSLGLDIHNLVDISDSNNYELAMRFSTDVKNKDVFYTDLNSMQIVRRRHYVKLPLQANFYPLPSMAFIEDHSTRLTILSAQPLGMAALEEGQMEVILDRRLNQDDNRGLGQGVTDNHPTPSSFRLLVERRLPSCMSTARNHPAAFPSLGAHVALSAMLHPTVRLLSTDLGQDLALTYSPTTQGAGVDLHLVTMVEVPGGVGVVMFNQHIDRCIPDPIMRHLPLSNGVLNISSLLPGHFGEILQPSTITFLHQGVATSKQAPLPVCPMEMVAFVLSR